MVAVLLCSPFNSNLCFPQVTWLEQLAPYCDALVVPPSFILPPSVLEAIPAAEAPPGSITDAHRKLLLQSAIAGYTPLPLTTAAVATGVPLFAHCDGATLSPSVVAVTAALCLTLGCVGVLGLDSRLQPHASASALMDVVAAQHAIVASLGAPLEACATTAPAVAVKATVHDKRRSNPASRRHSAANDTIGAEGTLSVLSSSFLTSSVASSPSLTADDGFARVLSRRASGSLDGDSLALPLPQDITHDCDAAVALTSGDMFVLDDCKGDELAGGAEGQYAQTAALPMLPQPAKGETGSL